MAFNAFLQIDGIPGECTESEHKEWITVRSYNHSMLQQSTGGQDAPGSLSGGRVDHANFIVDKFLDKASPLLYAYCSSGKHIPAAVLEAAQAVGKQEVFMQFKFEKLVIASVTCEGVGVSAQPVESIALNYAKLEWTYNIFDDTGSKVGTTTGWWSLETNTGSVA